MTNSNREKINFIEETVSKKGYSYNSFKLEYIGGQKDVVWNIPVAPHRVCEYFRQHDVKIIPLKGNYGLTSLWFDADPFPNRFYELVEGLPVYNPDAKKSMIMDVEEVYDFLTANYPTMVDAVKEHYPDYDKVDVIEFLITKLNFKDFVMELPNNQYMVEDIVESV